MTHFPDTVGPIYTPERPQPRTVDPVQPARRVDDQIRRQRQLAREPVPVEKAEQRLRSLSLDPVSLDLAEGRNAKRAVGAYAAIARVDDREIVSQMLGVDEFA